MSPSDRELLEGAAKAAGHEIARIGDDGDSLMLFGVQEPWRPHRDDGDCARLEVAIEAEITIGSDFVANSVFIDDQRANFVEHPENHKGDKNAARRRASTRAAAAVGETL